MKLLIAAALLVLVILPAIAATEVELTAEGRAALEPAVEIAKRDAVEGRRRAAKPTRAKVISTPRSSSPK